ncbi:lipoyl(octanoyl) transferase LipB [Marinobacterium sedimentorum]|uniref:lipoyl(octanoyl) transferase LipB n=1 Tax=Marinobacterium sedimentorum TaxID=2927804 RepID=UPI0020C5C28E|nr:lipoyl(octanoyl) transferase LipB [Marinobacterium sedimentorum]MCP8686006.1 lipoyl(octanoyl) transferase LipB [Marinobacterium sedimentorum]
MAVADTLILRSLGQVPYDISWQQMQDFTNSRDDQTPDEIWLLEHAPVFTQGQAGKAEHVLNAGDIPVVQADRGGQVTYHGPGQLVVYLLLNLRRKSLGVRDLVDLMEQSVVELLGEYGIEAYPKPDAPGVYVGDAKICSLGLRVRRGCSFHGLALNLDMNMEPFLRINPCGYAGMAMTQLSSLVSGLDSAAAVSRMGDILINKIGYTTVSRRTRLD